MQTQRPVQASAPEINRKKIKSEKPSHRIFISYSHKDERWLEELKVALKNLSRAFALDSWDDTRIPAGTMWREEIDRAIRDADIAIILGSRNFMASDFITQNELLPILRAHRKRGLSVLWIAVSYFNHDDAKLGGFQALNNPSNPLSALSGWRRDKAWVDIEVRMKEAIESHLGPRPRRAG